MARILTIGFEENSLTAGLEANGLTITGTHLSIVASPFHAGSFAMQTNPAAGSANYIEVPMSADTSQFLSVWISIAVLPAAATSILMFLQNGVAVCYIDLQPSGALQLRYSNNAAGQTIIGSNSTPLTLNKLHCIELSGSKANGSANATFEAKLNGGVFASSAVVDSATTGNIASGVIVVGDGEFEASASGNWTYDDVVLNDSTGLSENSYPSFGHQSITLRPNAAGDSNDFPTQTGGTAGAANNFTRVDEITPDDATSNNASGTVFNTDDFNLDNTPLAIGANDVINCIQLMVRYAGLSTIANASFEPRIKKASGGTVQKGSAITPSLTTYTTALGLTAYTDPDGNPWTKATLDSAQIGYDISAAITNAAAISAIWLIVDFTHPTEVVGQHNYLRQGFQ